MNDGRPQASDEGGGHTSVVYVHGMGEQRRYEEVSRLVDALDGCSNASRGCEGASRGVLTKIRARLEESKSDPKRDVAYIRTYYAPKGVKSPGEWSPYRFYEVYWAPLAAGGRSAWAVTVWLLRQVMTPLSVLRSRWRDRQRLRRASLHSLWESVRRSGAKEPPAEAFAQLFRAYNAFEGPEARREFPGGTFSEFLSFVEEKNRAHPERLEGLLLLARLWRRHHAGRELLNLIVLLSLILALAIGFGGVILLVSAAAEATYQALPRIGASFPGASLGRFLGPAVTWGKENSASVALALLSVLGIARFLRDYLGDVQIWSTYQETDTSYQKRREILDSAVGVLTHVLLDPKCERVIVVAHSLGSAIAIDALLELGRHNRARHAQEPMVAPLDLRKLDQVVTLGSPIDKIHYFFESSAGSNHRYNRVVEEVRGDLGGVPFAKNRKPHIHWLNFWDAGDVISGPLESASNPRDPWLRIDNVRVQSLRFPDPAASHSAYFQNRDVVGHLFDIIFEGGFSLRRNNRMAKQADLPQEFLGPGGGSAFPRFVQGAALAIPWVATAGVIAHALDAPALFVSGCTWLAALLVGGLGLGWVAGKVADPLRGFPITVTGDTDEDE